MTLKATILVGVIISASVSSCKGQNNNSIAQSPNNKQSVNDSKSTDTTGQLMNLDEFWKLIDKSRTASNDNYQLQINSLKTILSKLEPIEIVKFDNTFTALLAASYDWNLWGAAYVINGGCSDDCFHYFRQYLIGHGRDKFYQTLKDPDSSASWIKSEEEDNWEGLQYAAMEAYKLKTGKYIPKKYNPKFELKGMPFDEETVFKQYPKLAKKFIGVNY